MPAVISAAEGVYTAVGLLLLNEPVPLVDQVALLAAPPNVPAIVAVAFEQMTLSGPALIVATGSMLINTVLMASEQGPAPSGSSLVSVNVMLPGPITGVYVEVSDDASENDPEAADHVDVAAAPPILPASVTLLPVQIVCGIPALAVAAELTVRIAAAEVALPRLLVKTALY